MATVPSSVVLSLINYEEKCRWNEYSVSLPISAENFILEKYILATIFIGFCAAGATIIKLCGLLLCWITTSGFNKIYLIVDSVSPIFSLIVMCQFSVAAVLYSVYRYGIKIAGIVNTVSIGIICSLGPILRYILIFHNIDFSLIIFFSCLALVACGSVAMYFSYKMSIKFLEENKNKRRV